MYGKNSANYLAATIANYDKFRVCFLSFGYNVVISVICFSTC